MSTSLEGHVRIHDLVFSLTRQCNAYCDFCCNDDGPDKRGVIDPQAAKQWIRDFAAYVPYCRTAGFTGGEVFLRYKEMEEIHRALHEYDFKTSITTNGYWGKSPELAKTRLNHLKTLGLTEIAVSIDPSHIDWVPLAHSTMAVKIALECGLMVAVTSHFKSKEGSAKDYFDPEYHPYIIWDESHYVLPVGRAKHLPKESFMKEMTEGPLLCPRVQVVIQPNGDVDPCCSVCLDDGVFVVGNLYRQTMPEVLVNMLGELLEKNPKLMQAALSGLQESLTKELKASGLDKQVSAATLQSLGKMATVDGGNPVADDYVASRVSSVLHIVKVGVADLANNLNEISRLNQKVNLQVNKLNLGQIQR